jgi:hypothetical protein
MEKYNRVRSDATKFQAFMVENRWFPNKGDCDAEFHNESDYNVMIEKQLNYLKDGIDARPRAIERKLPTVKMDDKWMRGCIDVIESDLAYMRERFKVTIDETSPCMCRPCMIDRKQYRN